jgi:hypothetical protein
MHLKNPVTAVDGCRLQALSVSVMSKCQTAPPSTSAAKPTRRLEHTVQSHAHCRFQPSRYPGTLRDGNERQIDCQLDLHPLRYICRWLIPCHKPSGGWRSNSCGVACWFDDGACGVVASVPRGRRNRPMRTSLAGLGKFAGIPIQLLGFAMGAPQFGALCVTSSNQQDEA